MSKLLTLKEIAQQLDLPPATVKYYRDQFEEFMPAVSAGRYPKYSVEVLEVISDIRRLFQEGCSREQVAESLGRQHAINQGADLTTTTKGTTAQQSDKALYILNKQTNLLQEQQATIAKQAAIIEQLTEQLNRERRVKEQLLLQEIKARPKPEVKRPWWKRGKH